MSNATLDFYTIEANNKFDKMVNKLFKEDPWNSINHFHKRKNAINKILQNKDKK